MTKELTLEVRLRTERGKNANRRLRRQGKVAGVVYGLAQPPQTVELARREIVTMLREGATENSIFVLRMEGSESHPTMIRELQVDPIDRSILHIDFQRIDLARTVTVKVAVELAGVPDGVKKEGGILEFITREVEVESLPALIPSKLVVDVSDLRVGQHAVAGDLVLPEGVTLGEDPQRVIVGVALPKVAEEAPAEEALIEAERAEPELIGRGKAEEEGEEGEG